LFVPQDSKFRVRGRLAEARPSLRPDQAERGFTVAIQANQPPQPQLGAALQPQLEAQPQLDSQPHPQLRSQHLCSQPNKWQWCSQQLSQHESQPQLGAAQPQLGAAEQPQLGAALQLLQLLQLDSQQQDDSQQSPQ
jgi:hypothetical protein